MPSMDDPVIVKLTEADLAERATQMATKLEHVRVLRVKLKADAKATKTLIDSELDDLERMARVVLESEEEARQGDLFVDGTLGRVAGELAKRCACEGGPDAEVKDSACPLHGIADGDAPLDDEDDEDEPDDDESVGADPVEQTRAMVEQASPEAVEQLAADLRAAGIGEEAPVEGAQVVSHVARRATRAESGRA